jgi:ribA/ribD-fused uncharacterized protein
MDPTYKNPERTYFYADSCIFRKTKEQYGGLSNMASGFPLKVNGIFILTSEALYQACRFPHLPDVQKKIIAEKSPMSAKMVSKPFRSNSRPDWERVRNEVMYWCLRVKLAQNFDQFGTLLASTGNKFIVEESSKDRYWGAIPDKVNPSQLVGVNALGRLLMKLREHYLSESRYDLLHVEPLSIPDFNLYGSLIEPVEGKSKFSTLTGVISSSLSQPKVQEPESIYKPNEVLITSEISAEQKKKISSEPQKQKAAKSSKKRSKSKKSGESTGDLFEGML